jgi:hypothetical protein
VSALTQRPVDTDLAGWLARRGQTSIYGLAHCAHSCYRQVRQPHSRHFQR